MPPPGHGSRFARAPWSSMSQQNNQSASPRLKILVAFFLLVALSVVAIVATAALSHWIASSYGDAVTLNRAWAARLAKLSDLREEVAELDAPANDIFVSAKPAQELER